MRYIGCFEVGMQKHPILVALFVSSILACAVDGTGASAGTKNKASKGDTTEKADSAATSSDVARGSAIDGTWDITAAGSASLGPSQMTIKGGTVNGVVVGANEGQMIDDTCSVAKDRTSFSLDVIGDKLTGTITTSFELSGPDCGTSSRRSAEVTATRKHAESNAKGATAVEGEWVIEAASPIAVSVAGLVAKAWDQAAKANGDPPALTTQVKGDQATTTPRDTYLFAARKR